MQCHYRMQYRCTQCAAAVCSKHQPGQATTPHLRGDAINPSLHPSRNEHEALLAFTPLPVLVQLGVGPVGRVEVAGGVQQVHPHQNGHKAAQLRHHRAQLLPLEVLEHDARGDDGGGGEEHVVDGGDDGGVEDVERLVQVVHLHHHAPRHHQHAVGRLRVEELVVPLEGELDGDPQGLAAHHRQGAHHRADADVHHDLGVPVHGGRVQREGEGEEEDARRVHGEPWLQGEVPDLFDRLQLALRGRVQHDDHGAHDAQEAAEHAEGVQLLVQHEMRQECADYNAERAQGVTKTAGANA
eukprot:CAMPEP_0118938680 /NCGR_PEP_ID=MMETSP1169-20130426/26755_1 /TAXON_ID=36882 /ORGANISM="Pyramimonas obovata, Strain CCMP722" /LENGTH=296 /DNA_ID=CAMNT_0006882701 /DNA_START=85 /DNA_END=977 /DNA_ORIENTATION=-